MARHIYIGTEGSQSYTNGALAAGGIDVQKISMGGPTSMAPGDLKTNTEQFRIVQGTAAGRDIVSPWLYGKDIINWDGKSYLAAVAHEHRVTLALTSSAAGTISIKVVRTDEPGHQAFHFDTAVATGITAAAAAALVKIQYDAATKPDWLSTTLQVAGATFDVVGILPGGVASSGSTWDDNPPTFVVSCTDVNAGLTAVWTLDSAPNTRANAGHGGGYLVRKIEEQWWGNQFGTYDRAASMVLNPPHYSVVTTNYDVFSIAATKDGSSQSQIHGVDNIMEIAVAIPATSTLIFENQINPYMADCGFAPVNL